MRREKGRVEKDFGESSQSLSDEVVDVDNSAKRVSSLATMLELVLTTSEESF